MWFGAAQDVKRKRAGWKFDKTSGRDTRSDWDNADVIALPDSAVDRSSTSMIGDATRTGALESRSLFCPGDADVEFGDRIIDEHGVEYSIDGVPDRVRNPFTGWAPPMEVPLKRGVG